MVADQNDNTNNVNWTGKRLRAHLACEACRKRKIRCDSSKPSCLNCERSEVPCVYPLDGRRKRKIGSKPDVSSSISSLGYESPKGEFNLEQRLGRVEALLEALLERTSKSLDSVANTPGTSSEITAKNDPKNDYKAIDDDTTSSARLGAPRDILMLSHRRAPVVIKLGDNEPLVTYTHGFTTTLLHPRRMRRLCEHIGCHELGVAAEKKLKLLWKRRMEMMLSERSDIGLSPSLALDVNIIEQGIQDINRDGSSMANVLISRSDIEQVQRIVCPTGDYRHIDYSSPYSLLYSTVVMQVTGLDSKIKGYTTEYVSEQNLLAFKLTMRTALPSCHSTFLLLRLLIFAMVVIHQRTFFPQLRSFVAVAISMATDLGLHRGDCSRLLSPPERRRRELVWTLLRELDVKLAASMACAPLCSEPYWPMLHMKPLSGDLKSYEEGDSGTNMEWTKDCYSLATSSKLNQIYVDMFQQLFSPQALENSVRGMMDKLCGIVVRLNEWYKTLPQSTRDIMADIERREDLKNREFSMIYRPEAKEEESKDNGGDEKADGRGTAGSTEPLAAMEEDDHMSWKFIKNKIELNSLMCYYNILLLLHSVPAFSPSSLQTYREVPGPLKDSLGVLDSCAKQILKLAFSDRGLQSLGVLPLHATSAFSAMFLKQVREPRHPKNGEELVLIYQYIFRFRKMISLRADYVPGVNLVLSLWLTFANVLSQLNKEWLRDNEPGTMHPDLYNNQFFENGNVETPHYPNVGPMCDEKTGREEHPVAVAGNQEHMSDPNGQYMFTEPSIDAAPEEFLLWDEFNVNNSEGVDIPGSYNDFGDGIDQPLNNCVIV